MKPTVPLLAILLGFVVQTTALADIIHVPADYPTIQAAIAAATDGDEIIVAPGTYNETIDFLGKAITLRSFNGPEVTTIDATGLNDSVVRCMSGEGPETVLEGFTITGGTGRHSPVPPTVLGGGGMFNLGSSPTVTDCIFVGNTAVDGEHSARGGGMYNLNGSSPTVTGCLFTRNTATATGGMYNIEGSSPLVIDCDFIENSATGQAGMTNGFNNPTIVGCRFIRNTATQSNLVAGGILMFQADAVVANCIFVDNSAGAGSGIMSVQSTTMIINCIFSGNHAQSVGGAIANVDGTTEMANCTITNNSGGGLFHNGDGQLVADNCIFRGNEPSQVFGKIDVNYSCIEGGFPGKGNIDADPLFVDPDGPDDDPETWEDNDYRLQADSPCIDAADSSAVPPDIETDLDGNPRFVDDPDTDDTGAGNCPFVDMGAFEYQEGVAGCCPADFDGDGGVGASDLAQLLGSWGPYEPCPPFDAADFNEDCGVNAADLAQLLGNWGPCP